MACFLCCFRIPGCYLFTTETLIPLPPSLLSSTTIRTGSLTTTKTPISPQPIGLERYSLSAPPPDALALYVLQQIHALVMSLSYTGIEIKIVHALESWDRGVLMQQLIDLKRIVLRCLKLILFIKALTAELHGVTWIFLNYQPMAMFTEDKILEDVPCNAMINNHRTSTRDRPMQVPYDRNGEADKKASFVERYLKKILLQFQHCVTHYFNLSQVQKAFHINITKLSYPWQACGDIVYVNWTDSALSVPRLCVICAPHLQGTHSYWFTDMGIQFGCFKLQISVLCTK
ncbi:hypothetical protein L1987_17104 [Smallanthus sonchifolius]|uniref:Uncharacterized protein n=1 Tax=Smallanthus sonchifolius TaxID=185202 RepID=A0ACB9IZF3_9ASTR|nr:hypothetical protein L1987_17104 [Smallanthus sonchifolius]